MLELLPHLQGTWGSWTQSTDNPTVNGRIVYNTDIHHVGYPLDHTSNPNCSLYNASIPCVGEKQRRWDVRDFEVDWTIIERFVQTFVLDPPRTCSDFERRAQWEFVIYNAHCRVDHNNGSHDHGYEHRHFYRSRDSFLHLKNNNDNNNNNNNNNIPT